MNNSLKIDTVNIINWFNAIRNLSDKEKTRALDAFWAGQIESKCWLVNTLNEVQPKGENCYVFGGWVGLLGNMLLECATWNLKKVRSIDIDPWCQDIADSINQKYLENDWQFKACTSDMKDFVYDWNLHPNVVINTSTEHVDQNTFDIWWDNIPLDTTVVLQGNDYFSCSEHVRCSNDLYDFKRMNHVTNLLYEGVLPTLMYNRFMVIFKK